MKLPYNILKKKKKKSTYQKEDPKKEMVIKNLISLFEENDFRVRREKLQQGFGWKAVSGACRVNEENLIFLDRRLAQDEQMIFLVDKMKEKKITISEELLDTFPEKIKKII